MHTGANADMLARELARLRAQLAEARDGAEAHAVAERAFEELAGLVAQVSEAENELAAQAEQLEDEHSAAGHEADHYGELFDPAPYAYVVTTSDGLILEVNAAAAALLDVRPQFVARKPFADFFELDGRRKLRGQIAKIDRLGGSAALELRLRRRSGVALDVALTATAARTVTGEISEIRWQLSDVTEERQLERRLFEPNAELERRVDERTAELRAEQQRLRAVIDHLPSAVLFVDVEGRIVSRNPPARALFGAAKTVAALSGQRPGGKALGATEWPIARSLARGEAILGEQIEIRKGRGYVLVEAASRPFFAADGSISGAVMRLEDVTLRDARERAEREFITNAAHEIRTPLAAIAAAVEVLQAGAKELPEQRDLFLEHIDRECDRLTRLGRALLTLARAQALQEEPRRELVRVRELLVEIAEGLRPPETIQISVACDGSAAVITNPDLLRQALWNLAANAIRYTNRGRVSLAAEPAGEGRLAIEIHDTGPGIPEQARAHVLEPFYQAGSDREGFGVGLGIVGRAVEAIGATLELEAPPDGGTVARIVLPSARLLTEVSL